MARQQNDALGWLRRVSAEATDLFDRLANTAHRATDRTSEVLVGVSGAAVCLLIAYGVSVAFLPVSFALSGPIAACIGLPVSILAWRGRRRFRLERDIRENRLAADEIMDRIRLLPKTAPPQLREALWSQYYSITAALRPQQTPSLRIDQPITPALPPPTQRSLALPPPEHFGGQRKQQEAAITHRRSTKK